MARVRRPSPDPALTRLLGTNHVALEVDDVEEALAFYGRFFEFTLRRRSRGAAFIDIGDQFGRDHVLVASSARCSALDALVLGGRA